MSCPVLGCDLPGCHDDLDEGPRRGRWPEPEPDEEAEEAPEEGL